MCVNLMNKEKSVGIYMSGVLHMYWKNVLKIVLLIIKYTFISDIKMARRLCVGMKDGAEIWNR